MKGYARWGFTRIHEFFVIYNNDGEWEIWKKTKNMGNIEQKFLSFTNSQIFHYLLRCWRMGGNARWELTQIHEFFLIYNDGGDMAVLPDGDLHKLFIDYHDNGEWEDMPYKDMENMEEN